MSEANRTVIWWSSGAASVVAAKLTLEVDPKAICVRCETANEDEDNYRFDAEASAALGVFVHAINSDKYASVPDVWDKRRFMSGPKGAPCTTEMKVAPRLKFQRPTDLHVFGYTADRDDVERFERFKTNFFEVKAVAPLIEKGITKAAALAMVERMGLVLPRTYAMGFPNANCLQTGCVKATSPDYWSLLRLRFPNRFEAMAARSRSIGARLARINGERVFIDEIPTDWPVTQPIAPYCDFLCALAEKDAKSS
jgi:hypothetical protein